MFTGIIEAVGSVMSMSPQDDLTNLVVSSPGLFGGLELGASVAFNGVCLTATEITADEIQVQMVPETLERTNLSELALGARVNLERAMTANGRFDGHIVQGHVDGTVELLATRLLGESREFSFGIDPDLAQFVVEKGSVTLNGVSLTVTGTEADSFGVALIPHTLAVTNLGELAVGDRLNLETDVLAKYVQRLLSKS